MGNKYSKTSDFVVDEAIVKFSKLVKLTAVLESSTADFLESLQNMEKKSKKSLSAFNDYFEATSATKSDSQNDSKSKLTATRVILDHIHQFQKKLQQAQIEIKRLFATSKSLKKMSSMERNLKSQHDKAVASNDENKILKLWKQVASVETKLLGAKSAQQAQRKNVLDILADIESKRYLTMDSLFQGLIAFNSTFKSIREAHLSLKQPPAMEPKAEMNTMPEDNSKQQIAIK